MSVLPCTRSTFAPSSSPDTMTNNIVLSLVEKMTCPGASVELAIASS
jgi:hypothetical protein